MEIVEYKPRYKKAIIDLVNKHKKIEEADQIIEGNLEAPENFTYCGLHRGKFKAAIVGVKQNTEDIIISYWISTEPKYGIELAMKASEIAKVLGFKRVFFYRSKEDKFIRKDL